MNFIKVAAFSLMVIGLFAGFSNFGIPQIKPAPPPVEEVLDLDAMTPEQFVALGGKIYNGKGTCTLCHNAVGGRAPMLDNLSPVISQRLKDDRYKGEATDAESYLRESMIEPSAFVVVGFGKSGTNDTVSPMPDVSSGSIRLNEAELAAVIAHLQDSTGLEVTVKIPSGAGDAAAASESEDEGKRPLFTDVEQIVEEFSCGACHRVGEEEGEVGPDLRKIGGDRDREYLRRAILDPNAELAKGFEADQMPLDYGEQLYAKELEMLVDYLAGLK
jgi:mono/diheme cytochrome c family protein